MAYIGPAPNPGQNREVDDISSSFNGSTTAFTLQVNSQNVSPGSANSIVVSLGGVVQNPGTDYTIAASTITFTTPPASGLSFFGLVLGQGIDAVEPADGSVSTAKLADQAVSLAKLPHGTVSNDGKFLRANNGADPTFETVTGTTINNNANNRVITGSGTANTLEAESGLTFDGTHLSITDGDLVIATDGHGIDFSATADGTGSGSVSELLDDYETGTWTGAIGTGTANINNPWYVKIGKLVIGGASITAISDTSSSNIIKVTGLPFSNSGGYSGSGTAGASKNDQFDKMIRVFVSGTEVQFMVSSLSTGSHDYLRHSSVVQSSGSITFGFNYRTA